jgi:peptide/nickel transport system permease protein
MAKYLLKRIIYIIPILFGVTVGIFFIVKLVPGDTAVAILGPAATKAQLEEVRRILGLDMPFYVQYFRWLKRILVGDFGLSIALNVPVSSLIFQKYGNTLILAMGSLILSVFWGVPTGLISATKQYSVFDRFSMILALVLASVPVFWLGLVLMYVFAVNLRWLPALGMYDIRHAGEFWDLIRHLILPSITTAAIPMAIIARLVRTSLLDVLRQDYIVALRAKGLGWRSIYRHSLRNVLPQIVNIIALQGGFLIASTIFTEVVFNWPGLGLQIYSSIVARDLPMIQASVILISFSFVVLNMGADVVCYVLDPRQRTSGETGS